MFSKALSLVLLGLLFMIHWDAAYAKQVKVQGTIRQENIPPVCMCGSKDGSGIYNIPDGDPDCVPHIVTTLTCGIYSYDLTVFACNDIVGVTLTDGDSDNDKSCQIEYGIGASCELKWPMVYALCSLCSPSRILCKRLFY